MGLDCQKRAATSLPRFRPPAPAPRTFRSSASNRASTKRLQSCLQFPRWQRSRRTELCRSSRSILATSHPCHDPRQANHCPQTSTRPPRSGAALRKELSNPSDVELSPGRWRQVSFVCVCRVSYVPLLRKVNFPFERPCPSQVIEPGRTQRILIYTPARAHRQPTVHNPRFAHRCVIARW